MNKQHGNSGRRHSAETKRRMAEAKLGNKNALLYPQKPPPLPINKIQKLRAANAHASKGKPKSAEHRLRISRSLTGNRNAATDNICPNKLQTRQSAQKLKQAAEDIYNKAIHANTGRKQSPETIAKIRAALAGNTNALRNAHIPTKATQKPITTEAHEEISDLETELMAMLNKDKTLPLHPAPPKPQDIQETPEEREIRQRKNAVDVLGKDFFDGWEDTPTTPNTLDNMRDFFETDAEFQEWKATQNE